MLPFDDDRKTRVNTGYGVVSYYLGKEVFTVQVRLGKRSTIYDAEMFALAH